MDEFIKGLEKNENFSNVTPMVNMCKKERVYTNRRLYSAKMISPMSRREFADYYTKLVTGSDSNIIVNEHVININDYTGSDEKSKVKSKTNRK